MTTTVDGIRIFDVWESQEALENFQDWIIAPVFRKVGVVDPPETRFFEVQNYFVASRKDWPPVSKPA